MKNKLRTPLFIGILAGLSLSVIAQPNVLVIMTDDQGYPEISAHGNPVLQTPNLDRLHGQSVRLLSRLPDVHAHPRTVAHWVGRSP